MLLGTKFTSLSHIFFFRVMLLSFFLFGASEDDDDFSGLWIFFSSLFSSFGWRFLLNSIKWIQREYNHTSRRWVCAGECFMENVTEFRENVANFYHTKNHIRCHKPLTHSSSPRGFWLLCHCMHCVCVCTSAVVHFRLLLEKRNTFLSQNSYYI